MPHYFMENVEIKREEPTISLETAGDYEKNFIKL